MHKEPNWRNPIPGTFQSLLTARRAQRFQSGEHFLDNAHRVSLACHSSCPPLVAVNAKSPFSLQEHECTIPSSEAHMFLQAMLSTLFAPLCKGVHFHVYYELDLNHLIFPGNLLSRLFCCCCCWSGKGPRDQVTPSPGGLQHGTRRMPSVVCWLHRIGGVRSTVTGGSKKLYSLQLDKHWNPHLPLPPNDFLSVAASKRHREVK